VTFASLNGHSTQETFMLLGGASCMISRKVSPNGSIVLTWLVLLVLCPCCVFYCCKSTYDYYRTKNAGVSQQNAAYTSVHAEVIDFAY
jgi:hypothetical protein